MVLAFFAFLAVARAAPYLSFEANLGQTDSRVQFLSRGRSHTLFLAPTEAVFRSTSSVLRLRLAGADPRARMSGAGPLPALANYFIGSDPAQWRTNIPSYARVRCDGVYRGVDLVYYGNEWQLEYDLIVAPGASPAVIRLAFEGARAIRIDGAGDLVLATAGGEIRQRRPLIYQELAGGRHLVSGGYILKRNREVGFVVGAYDHSRPLVIDPVLRLSSYLGGAGEDRGAGIAADAAGNVYIAGTTAALNFPTTSPLQRSSGGGRDVFVTKLNNSGGITYSTYLGGAADDTGAGIAVDASGNAYITGTTSSTNFPVTAGAFRTSLAGSSDAFVAKLDPNGSSLIYSTYLGGSQADQGAGVAVDAAGSAYVTGTTASSGFPVTPGAFAMFLGGTTDAFVAKLNAAGTGLSYATFLGGGGPDQGVGIAVDAFGNAYVTGSTSSPNDFPTASPIQSACALSPSPFGESCFDAFVTKLNSAGAALFYSTYLGGSFHDEGHAIAVDAFGNAYVTGVTNSADFRTTFGAFRTARVGANDAFVTKLNAAGALAYSTYLGGGGDDAAVAIAVDSSGRASVAGSTTSTDFPTANPLQAACATTGGAACADAFVTRLNAAGSALVFSTYFGGTGADRALGITSDSLGSIYV